MKNRIIGRTTEGFFRYQAWPTVARARDGTLYVAASGSRLGHVCPFGKNLLYISRDEGESWSAPYIVNDTVWDDRDAGLCAWGDGNLLLSWFSHPAEFYEQNRDWVMRSVFPGTQALAAGMLETWKKVPPEDRRYGSFTRLSGDGGMTWSEARHAPVTSPHGPERMPDGSLLWLGKEFRSGMPELEPGGIYAFGSTDNGQSWNLLSQVAFPAGCGACNIHEPHTVCLPGGRILGALRGEGSAVPFGFTVYLTHSDDGGRHWSEPAETGICGSPPHLLRHSSGAVILTYARRKASYGERARISTDGGETFGEEIVIGAEAPDGDIGYPSSAELSDGSILTVYYQKYPGDGYPSVLGTVWNTEEYL